MSNLDDFDAPPTDEPYAAEAQSSPRSRLSEALKTNPAFKIFLILVGVGALASAAMGVFSGGEKRDNTSIVRSGSAITSTPGGEASPAFQQAVQEASQQRAEEAAKEGSSALPTPLGGQTQITTLDPSAGNTSDDPLSEFKATQIEETAPRDLEPAAPPAPVFSAQPQLQQQIEAQPMPDQNTIQAMAQKMQQLTDSWRPNNIRVLQVTAPVDPTTTSLPSGQQTDPLAQYPQQERKIKVPAGTINYGQMMVEANSDVPGSVMAKIMSGPLAGGRAIGTFQTAQEKLVIRFSLVSVDGKDYPVDILALDPSSTNSGLATDYDPRYWERVFLPAAADFVSGFANAFAQADQNVTVQDGVVITSRAGASLRQAAGEGTAKAGERLADILNEQGTQVQPLIKVAAGTPIGLFFTQSVYEDPQDNLYGGYDPYGNPYGNPYGGGYGGAGIPGLSGAAMNGLSGIIPNSSFNNTGNTGLNNGYGQGLYNSSNYANPYGNNNAPTQIAPGVSYYGNSSRNTR